MGRWVLEGITNPTVADYDTPDRYGHEISLTFQLRYRPALIGRFSETPRLVWHEQVRVNQHRSGVAGATGTRSEWETDQYERHPTSGTTLVWAQRYLLAHNAAQVAAGTAQPHLMAGGGSVAFLDANGIAVNAQALRVDGAGPRAEADAVRHYLKRHGSTLQIVVHDRPSFARPTDAAQHRERLLLLTIGVRRGRVWRMGSQYLNVDGTLPLAQWERQFQWEPEVRGAMPSWDARTRAGTAPQWVQDFSGGALERVDPNALLTQRRPPLFGEGEVR